MNLNRAIIAGNLTREPDFKSLPSGVKVCNLGVATNRVWTNRDGQKQEAAEFHNVAVFGRQAELCSQYLKKGQTILVEGRLQTRSWEGQDGQKRYRTEIIADRVQFGSKAGGGRNDFSSGQEEAGGEKGAGVKEAEQIQYPEEEINPEDIPF